MSVIFIDNSVTKLRRELRSMTEPGILRYGLALKSMISHETSSAIRQTLVVRLRLAREEWNHRHSQLPLSVSLEDVDESS